MESKYDVIVIGAGHAGVEAALSASRLKKRVLLVAMSLDSIAFMACNPAIGGTAKGHLVREVDALGGEMGRAADANLLQLRMLNTAKGAAVQSLRGQADKNGYHLYMRRVLENADGLTLLEAEVVAIEPVGDEFFVRTALGERFFARAAVVATGVYLDSEIIIGGWRKKSGPSGFCASNGLAKSLTDLGFSLRRFKTGTPARILRRSIDFSRTERQEGDSGVYPFSFMTDGYIENKETCYLTYTNEKTHALIRKNIHLSPMYSGQIKGTGARYCPSIEDKIMRFPDKERHQIFIEPESASTSEMYVQGMSSSLPEHVQRELYRSVAGLERAEIVRYAYAIEYDCIDSTSLSPALMSKSYKHMFFAGQINGTSGYEEAAAQGLIAGINAARAVDGLPPVVLSRGEAYIGVLIDDLVTKGADEPYRMMTARAEYRLSLRQENADFRLTPLAVDIGLADDGRRARFAAKLKELADVKLALNGAAVTRLKRADYGVRELFSDYPELARFSERVVSEVAVEIKYGGYLARQESEIAEQKRLSGLSLDPKLDYSSISGLRLEARQKLNKIKPENVGQAARVSGVSPADITVLIAYVSRETFLKNR